MTRDIRAISLLAGEMKDSETFRTFKRQVLQTSLEVVLKPFKDASKKYVQGQSMKCDIGHGANVFIFVNVLLTGS